MSCYTDASNPKNYHKVVDCQYACPAHTNVPEYLRLIAQGRYTESYLLNRESNVFPGILGRTCDRPCEPACRRGRIDGKPVAICRLKRVAADLRDDIQEYLPKAPTIRNGKRIALIGAGPASLTVANDLLPLGYEVVIYEKYARAGGLMRFNIPAFRLPVSVLDEETGYIIDMGAEVRYNTTVSSLRELLSTSNNFDAVFVGSGAPKGKELDIPGRWDEGAREKIHIGIEWLGSVHFGHIDKISPRVLIIGVGNTAMDCCRTSRRLGGIDTKVVARRSRPYFKASPWELEDADEEGIRIVENHAPKRFVIEKGKLVGMEFERLRWTNDNSRQTSTVIDTVIIPCDEVILAIGQDNAFPWIERDIGIAFDDHDMPVINKTTYESTRRGVFFGGDAAWGPQNIIWAVEHGHQAAISIHQHCEGRPVEERPPEGMHSREHENGAALVGVLERLQSVGALEDAARRVGQALLGYWRRGGARLHSRADGDRSRALPELRHRNAFREQALHRVRRLRRRLSGELSYDHAQRERNGPANDALRPRAEHDPGSLRL